MTPAAAKDAPVLVTGGAGFIGSNLAARLAREGRRVIVLDSLARPGVEANIDWLSGSFPTQIEFLRADIRDRAVFEDLAPQVSAIFHLAAQVAVTSSLTDPLEDFDVNAAATLRLLDAVRRKAPLTPLIFASTNKVYGSLSHVALVERSKRHEPADLLLRSRGFGEDLRLDFLTPYGCSKGAADQYALDHARTFGMRSCVLRMSCIYGPRQMGTEDQGWLAHFARAALEGRPIHIYGDGKQVRDVLYVADAVDAYCAALQRIDRVKGHAFNLGGGPANAVSLLQVISFLEDSTGSRVPVAFHDWRPGDQLYYVSDTRRICNALDLPPPRNWQRGLALLLDWLRQNADSLQTRKAIPA